MTKLWLLALAFAVSVMPVRAATINVTITSADGKPLTDAVVSLDGPGLSREPAPRGAATPHVMDQVAKQFSPRVLAIRIGEQVSFPNRDRVRHQVYSFSKPKVFELPLYAGESAAPILFDKPGLVVLGCNIHDRMAGFIYVMSAPRFAVSTGGVARLRNVPPGQYTLSVQHPDMQAGQLARRQLRVVQPTADVAIRMQLRVKSVPAPAPSAPAPYQDDRAAAPQTRLVALRSAHR